MWSTQGTTGNLSDEYSEVIAGFGSDAGLDFAGVAADLRHRPDRVGLSVAGLPLFADQPASDRDLRHIHRRPSWTYGQGLRAGPGGFRRADCALDRRDGRARDRYRGGGAAGRSGRGAFLGYLLAPAANAGWRDCRGQRGGGGG